MYLRWLVTAILFCVLLNCNVVCATEINFQTFRKELVDPTYFDEYTLDLVPFNKRNVINGTLAFAKTIDMLTMEFSITVPRPLGNDMRFLNANLNACRTLAEEGKRNVVNLVLNELRKTKGFFPRKCPIPAAQRISIDHLTLSGASLPIHLMEFAFNVRMHFLVDGKYIVKHFINGTTTSAKSKG